MDNWGALFGESLGRILVSIKPENSQIFEKFMEEHECNYLGKVNFDDNIRITRLMKPVLSASMSELRDSWKGTLNGGRN